MKLTRCQTRNRTRNRTNIWTKHRTRTQSDKKSHKRNRTKKSDYKRSHFFGLLLQLKTLDVGKTASKWLLRQRDGEKEGNKTKTQGK